MAEAACKALVPIRIRNKIGWKNRGGGMGERQETADEPKQPQGEKRVVFFMTSDISSSQHPVPKF